MDQLMVNLTGAVVSGSFAVIAACVPQYLQSRKSQEMISCEIEHGEYYQYSFWYLLLGISFPLVCYFLVATIVLFYALAFLLTAAAQTPDPVAFTNAFDVEKAADIIRLTGKVELFFYIPLMFAVFLFTSIFLFHRSGRRASMYITLSAILVWSAEIALSIPFQSAALPMKDIIRNSIIFAFVYLIAAVIGMSWGKRTHKRFLVVYIFNRLNKPDQEAFFELAQSLVANSPNKE